MSSESENIQVVVRCRGRNAKETSTKSPVVVHVADGEGEEVIVNASDDTGVTAQLNSKAYRFDNVFGPIADQQAIFQRVASPLFDEFLKGYNCTLLVYGMTSTGKTYTMSGENKMIDGELSDKAGIIPRLIMKLFDVLEEAGDDYIVKCSFVELYNEELKDLLTDDMNKKLRIFDQKNEPVTSMAGNKSAIHIQNLQEVVLQDAPHGLKTLQKGLKLRQVAATKMNDVSSRSHTIFTLNLFKQNKDTGDLFRLSKMNLVDLAGSENISRSGALNQRAKEAGSINQSLLTLGRVINLLVEKNNQHIPYRESKLTRLLQDSLGGQTKTCLIATISPAKINYDETLSTLEYASKAKSIQNKPQLGLTLGREILLKELSAQLAKVKSDLSATRQKDGMFMDNDNYQELMTDLQESKTTIEESLREQEVLKKQNEQLRTQLKESEAQNIQHITIINTLNTTIDSLHNKIDEQKENEKNLMSSSTKFKTIIGTINDKISNLKTFENKTKAAVSDAIDTHLAVLKKDLTEVIGKSSKVHGADKSVTALESEIEKMSSTFKKTTSDACANVREILSGFPDVLENVQSSLADLSATIIEFENVMNDRFSDLSKENNQFKSLLSDSLFHNHTHLVKEIVTKTNQQLEDDANTLLNQFIDLMRENNNKQQSLVTNQIQQAVEKSMLAEKDQLRPAQTKWDESTRGIINDCDSLTKNVQKKYDAQLAGVTSNIQHAHKLTKSSMVSIDKELEKIPNVIDGFDKSKNIRVSLDHIKKDGELHQSAIESLARTKDSINTVETVLTENVVNQVSTEQIEEKDMSRMIDEIEVEQAELKKKLLPTGKTPKREPLQLPTHERSQNLTRSPPKFQLIGQRFQESETRLSSGSRLGVRKRKSDDEISSAQKTKLPKLTKSFDSQSRLARR